MMLRPTSSLDALSRHRISEVSAPWALRNLNSVGSNEFNETHFDQRCFNVIIFCGRLADADQQERAQYELRFGSHAIQDHVSRPERPARGSQVAVVERRHHGRRGRQNQGDLFRSTIACPFFSHHTSAKRELSRSRALRRNIYTYRKLLAPMGSARFVVQCTVVLSLHFELGVVFWELSIFRFLPLL